jgi:hypothetical protein
MTLTKTLGASFLPPGGPLRRHQVDVRPLKRFVASTLPSTTAIYAVIMGEPDEMSATDFLAKIPTWLKLVDHEIRSRRYQAW